MTFEERVRKLRSAVVRDPKTGRVIPKPSPPPMRTIIKGPWTYKEITPEWSGRPPREAEEE